MSKPNTNAELQKELAKLKQQLAEAQAWEASAREAVERLEVCQARYQALSEGVDYAVTHFDLKGTILKVNAVGAAMLKMTPDEVTGQSIYDLIPEAREQLPERFRYAIETGKTKRYELKIETVTGPHWLTSCYVPVRDNDGIVDCLLVISQDITDLKLAEEQQAILSWVISQTTEAITLVDLEGNIKFLNHAAAHMHGYEVVELVGKNISIFHTEDQMSAVEASLEQVRLTGEFSGELWHMHRDGTVFPTVTHNSILNDDKGEPVWIVGTAHDITEVKQAEKQQQILSSIVKQSSEGVALVDVEGSIAYVNDSFARMHGYEANEIIGKNLSIFHTADQMPAVLAANEEIRVTGKFNGEIWHVHRDGSVFPTVMHNSLLYDDKGEAIGIVGTLRDITERKLAEAELRESHERYKLLIDNIGCPIALYDMKGVLLLVNDDGARMLGGVPADFIGRSLHDIYQEDADKYFERNTRVIESGKPEEHLDEVDTPGGRRWIWSSGQPARKADGTIYGVQVIVRDVTELKESEESLRIMAGELKAERKTLYEKNIALKQILEYMENQKKDWASKLQAGLESALGPFLDELENEAGPDRSSKIDELRSTLRTILGADSSDFARRYDTLTGREVELCVEIAKGKSSKEIADDMNLSLLTVSKHREKIRNKLGLTGKRIDLSAYLRRHQT